MGIGVYILKIPCHQSCMLFTNTCRYTLPLECLNYHSLLTTSLTFTQHHTAYITAVLKDRIVKMMVSVHAYLTHTLWSRKQHCENCKLQKYKKCKYKKKLMWTINPGCQSRDTTDTFVILLFPWSNNFLTIMQLAYYIIFYNVYMFSCPNWHR